MHRLLKRQIKQHFSNYDTLTDEVKSFVELVGETYSEYDNDLAQVEHILKLSSHELFVANKELGAINKKNEDVINLRTKNLKKTQFTIESAEKIAGFCSISIHLINGSIELSPQFRRIFPKYNGLASFDLKSFIGEFESQQKIYEKISRAISNKERLGLDDLYHKPTKFYFELTCDILTDKDQEQIIVLVLHNVTGRKQLEKEREAMSEDMSRFMQAINTSAIVSATSADGTITFVNKTFCEISGYTESELLGQKHSILNSGFHDRDFFQEMYRTIYSGNIWKGIIRNKAKSGKLYWVDSIIVPFLKKGKIDQFISIRFDITEKVNASQVIADQRNFYESILNNIPVDIAIFNEQHQYLFVNPYAVKSEEIRKFLINKTDFDYCQTYQKSLAIAEHRHELFQRALETKSVVEFTDEVKKIEDGSSRFILRRFYPIYDAANEFMLMAGYGIDITEKILNTIALQESLLEKEALLGEVHHRVKNNLALIVGLIEMQLFNNKDDAFRLQMQIVLSRLNAIALIHDKLYKSGSFSNIKLSEYINEFLAMSFRAFDKSGIAKFKVECGEVYLSAKQAIPLALLINETSTNFLKYGVIDNKSPLLYVAISQKEDNLTVRLSDNGPGVPPGVNLDNVKSLGFRLIKIFLKQLKANHTISSDSGFTLDFSFIRQPDKI
jgi:PAS domain S-box-containing protein